MGVDPTIMCPKDASPMAREVIGRVSIDRCARCGGIWLDRGELATLRDEASIAEIIDADAGSMGQAGTKHALTPTLRCPRDASPLRSIRDPTQSHVQYEYCPVCGGVFLDAGELADLGEVTLRERVRGLFRRA